MSGGRLPAVFLLAALAFADAAAAQPITVGATSSTSDAPIYIAEQKGFFRAEGLDVKVSNFRSASDMVAPLGAGQLDAGAGSAGAALYNAVARGISIRIVADKASSPPGYGATKILVRKDLIDGGRYREPKDLKGFRFAMNAPGVSNTSTLNTLLKSVGLRYSDVETVDLPFPDHPVALKNKSVDAAASVEPGPAIAVKNGDAVAIKSDDEILPNHQIAVLLYSDDFALKRRADAIRFMRAYIRAVRFYNGALASGRLAGPNADEVIAILSQATPIKSRAIYAAITPTGMNPDGRVNAASLAYDLAFYREQGLIKGAVKLDDVLDGSFVDAVLAELGPYRP
ncbi:MAG TPA: ABC transporter substrate-binding protein [Xanthobacteraceae bacterium]|nr:ABC transporter substrate-binding protein [Xanthobacteraceae bacterium]